MLLPRPNQLQPLILWPRPAWHFEDLLRDALEAALLEPLLPAHGVVDGGAELGGCGGEIVGHCLEIGGGGHGGVVTLEDAGYALEFEPAAWLEVAVVISGLFDRSVRDRDRGRGRAGPEGTGRIKRKGVLLVGLVYKPREIANRGDEVPREDEVCRALLPGPVLLDVVELEHTIGRNPVNSR